MLKQIELFLMIQHLIMHRVSGSSRCDSQPQYDSDCSGEDPELCNPTDWGTNLKSAIPCVCYLG